MNNDLISREALKKDIDKFIGYLDEDMICRIKVVIDNAPTVEINTNEIEYKAYCKGLEDGKKITRPQGKWVRKEDIIHYIATQYSEHNELVPVWLNIGDLKGGAV